MTCPAEYSRAVEAVAGGGLFHCIVRDFRTAETLIDALAQKRLGRMSFIPLDSIYVKHREYHPPAGVEPLLGKLEFPEEVERAVRFVFGNAMVADDTDLIRTYQERERVRCVTLDGDVFTGKGVVSGGVRRDGILMLMDEVKAVKTRVEEEERTVEALEQNLREIDDAVKAVTQEMDGLSAQLAEEETRYERERMDFMVAMKKRERLKETVRRQERGIAECEKLIMMNIKKKALLERELHDEEPLDRTEFEKKRKQLDALHTQVVGLEQRRLDIENRRQIARNNLQFTLQERLLEAERRLREADLHADAGGDATKYRLLLQKQNAALAELTAALEAKASEEQHVDAAIRTEKAAVGKAREAEKQKDQRLTRLVEQQTVYEQKRRDCERRLEEIGANFDAVVSDDLERELELTHAELKKYRHVNKKARDQCQGFEEQLQALDDRQKEIVSTQQTILDLIDQLEQKKEEAIERTFKGVSKWFTDIFAKLVPGGEARLVMRRKEEEFIPSQSQPTQRQRTEMYTGISMKVRFSPTAEETLFQQLSGGQNTIVALALIFAIQRCDPAPFYLFDEIDANLDPDRREAVADLIKEQSKEAQYILSTFHPELLRQANKWYEISLSNKVSSITPITKEEALQAIMQSERLHGGFSTPFQTPQRPRDGSEPITPSFD